MKGLSDQLTTAQAEWLRITQACHLASISRSALYEWLKSGKVKSISLRKKGNSRGSRLVNAESLREFLNSCPQD
jgi:predicted site-specific integrase-resolvase